MWPICAVPLCGACCRSHYVAPVADIAVPHRGPPNRACAPEGNSPMGSSYGRESAPPTNCPHRGTASPGCRSASEGQHSSAYLKGGFGGGPRCRPDSPSPHRGGPEGLVCSHRETSRCARPNLSPSGIAEGDPGAIVVPMGPFGLATASVRRHPCVRLPASVFGTPKSCLGRVDGVLLRAPKLEIRDKIVFSEASEADKKR